VVIITIEIIRSIPIRLNDPTLRIRGAAVTATLKLPHSHRTLRPKPALGSRRHYREGKVDACRFRARTGEPRG
jgi:hypothetical protein